MATHNYVRCLFTGNRPNTDDVSQLGVRLQGCDRSTSDICRSGVRLQGFDRSTSDTCRSGVCLQGFDCSVSDPAGQVSVYRDSTVPSVTLPVRCLFTGIRPFRQ